MPKFRNFSTPAKCQKCLLLTAPMVTFYYIAQMPKCQIGALKKSDKMLKTQNFSSNTKLKMPTFNARDKNQNTP
jgi:hypothetical protein